MGNELFPSLEPLNPEEMKDILEEKLPGKILETRAINKELVIWVNPQDLVEVCTFLRDSDLDFNHPRCLTGVDRQDSLEVVYHLSSTNRNHKITIKVAVPPNQPQIPSLCPVYKGVNWHERETSEMLGIIFEGHPDPRHLLLVDDFEGYPLRKDFILNNSP